MQSAARYFRAEVPALFAVLLCVAPLGVRAEILRPNDDVSVRPGRGNLDEADPLGLLVKAGGSASFIEFTFGTTPVAKATLHLHNFWTNPRAPVNYDIRIKGGVYDFDETALTAANQPDDSGWEVVVESFHVDNQERSYFLDITAFYNAHLGQTVTFSLRSVGGSGDGPIFDDREGTGGHDQGPFIELLTEGQAPQIAEVQPDPEEVEAGKAYERQLELTQGSEPVTWTIVQGPEGLVVDQKGFLSGWLPTSDDIGKNFVIEVEAANAFGKDAESWTVTVIAPPPNPLVGGGWVVHFYKPGGAVTGFPDFENLEPLSAVVAPTIDFRPSEGQFVPQGLDFVDDFALRCEALITVPAGTTVFYLTADESARLILDGQVVLEHTNGGGPAESSAAVELEEGEHCICVEYFEHEGSARLLVEYAPPGGVRQVIPPMAVTAQPCVSGSVRIRKWHMLEIALTAELQPSNPFTDIDLTAEVGTPDGRTLQIDGYYDGNGRGGQEGNIWKLRLTPDVEGVWTWRTHSNDPHLNGQSGSFTCLPSNDQGALTAEGRYFRWRDGGYVYLIGNFLDTAAPAREQFSHTLLSEEITPENREHMIVRHRDFHRANKMNVYIANVGDYHGISTTPWLGSASSNDKTRFDLSRWRMYDETVARLGSEGILAELWFFADDSGFGDLSDSIRKHLIRYAMARLSAYAHTFFVLTLEWQEGWSASEVRSTAGYLQEHNPWNRLVSTHGTTGDFAFPNDSWADFMATQSGNSITPPGNNAHTIRNRALAEKPLLVEEFGILQTPSDSRLRGNLWAAFCGGAAGSGTGSDLARLRRFIEESGVPFYRMQPANSLADRGFVLAAPGEAYVVYLPDAEPVVLQLKPGVYQAAWYDPRGAAEPEGLVPIGTVEGGGRTFSPPGQGHDWVLFVQAVPEVSFVRGDSNSDGAVDLADAVYTLSFLFAGGPAATCLKAQDVNDDGLVDIADPIAFLSYLFAGDRAPSAPFPDCGTDPTDDSLSCERFAPCEPQ